MTELGKNSWCNERLDDEVDTYNDWVQVHSIHVQPLDLLQVSVLSLGRNQTHQARVSLLYPHLQLLRLVGEEPELRDIARAVARHIVVPELGWKLKDENQE